jgi:hypothetical protein
MCAFARTPHVRGGAPCPRERNCPRGCVFGSAGVRPRGRALSGRTLGCVRTDASVLFPGNFIMDAIVRPSHGRLSGHRLIVRPSVIVHVTALIVT